MKPLSKKYVVGVLERLGLFLLVISVVSIFFVCFTLNFDPDGHPARWWWAWQDGPLSPIGLWLGGLIVLSAGAFGIIYGTVKLIVWIATGKEIRITKD